MRRTKADARQQHLPAEIPGKDVSNWRLAGRLHRDGVLNWMMFLTETGSLGQSRRCMCLNRMEELSARMIALRQSVKRQLEKIMKYKK